MNQRRKSEKLMWRELIEKLDPGATFFTPATKEQLNDVEAWLGMPLPRSLREVLLETNGVEQSGFSDIIFSIEKIKNWNEKYRTEALSTETYMSFDSMLFFAESGTGDLFAFPITPSEIRENVFFWDHEEDNRIRVALSLEDFLEKWFNGTLYDNLP